MGYMLQRGHTAICGVGQHQSWKTTITVCEIGKDVAASSPRQRSIHRSFSLAGSRDGLGLCFCPRTTGKGCSEWSWDQGLSPSSGPCLLTPGDCGSMTSAETSERKVPGVAGCWVEGRLWSLACRGGGGPPVSCLGDGGQDGCCQEPGERPPQTHCCHILPVRPQPTPSPRPPGMRNQ